MTELGVAPVLMGRYELGAVIGVGGMARVHCGTDTVLGRSVAIKVFRVDADPAQAGRIENESRALAAVQHPGLVSVFDAGSWSKDDGSQVPFLVMEHVDGPTLAQCCTDGSLDVEQVVRIGADLAEALAHVHERGIVHRDVKPANILLAEGHRPKLTDFGIARLVDSARHTQTGTLVGTAAYLSPEQVQGREIGPATDIFALGLVLLEALTGRREYPGNNVETALARLERLPVVPEDLPAPVRQLLGRMTAAEPQNRPTAPEVAQALRSYLTGGDRTTKVITQVVPAPAATAPEDPAAASAEPAVVPAGEAVRLRKLYTPLPERGRSAFVKASRDVIRDRWVVGGVVLLLLLILAVAGIAQAGSDEPTAPASVKPGTQLEKDLTDLRDAVTP